jgi:hypothetical protein
LFHSISSLKIEFSLAIAGATVSIIFGAALAVFAVILRRKRKLLEMEAATLTTGKGALPVEEPFSFSTPILIVQPYANGFAIGKEVDLESGFSTDTVVTSSSDADVRRQEEDR